MNIHGWQHVAEAGGDRHSAPEHLGGGGSLGRRQDFCSLSKSPYTEIHKKGNGEKPKILIPKEKKNHPFLLPNCMLGSKREAVSRNPHKPVSPLKI